MAKRRSTEIPRELELSGELCLAFANTAAKRRDDRYRRSEPPSAPGLDDYADLLAWSRRMGAVRAPDAQRLRRLAAERSTEADAAHAQASELRAGIGRIFTAIARQELPSPRELSILNASLAELPPRLVDPEADGYGWTFAGPDDAFECLLWPISLSAAELLISDDRRWVRQCADAQCTRLFVDRHSRRRKWCDPNTCGSRARGKRFHRRGGRVPI